MKKLDDILKGFDLTDTWDDGTKQYTTKEMHFIQYDYFEVHHMTVYPDGNIELSVDTNCDLFERATDLDQYHVYSLTEIA